MVRSRKFLEKLWHTLAEPKAVTATMIAMYSVTAIGGASVILSSPLDIPWDTWNFTTILMGAFYMFAGILGAPMAHRGLWYWERGATIAGMSGSLLFVVVTSSEVFFWGLHVFFFTLSVAAFLMFLMRHQRISLSLLDPNK